MTPTPVAGFALPAESGAELLHPDAGTEAFRRRHERPAQVGRYAFAGLGAVTVGAAAGIWVHRYSALALALMGFGALLVVLALTLHLLLVRERAHWPRQAYLWDEGVEVVLANGEIRVAEWADPRFALDAFVRPATRRAPEEVLLGWRMDPKLPLCPITAGGLDRLRSAADAHGVQHLEYRSGSGPRAMVGFEFRPVAPAGAPHDSAAGVEGAPL